MKDQLSALDLRFLVKEMQVLVGGHLDKVYQGTAELKQDFLFQFHNKGKMFFRVILPGVAFLAKEKPSYGDMPAHFALFLRRHLGNARVTEIRQRDFERILEIDLENKNGVYTLLFEFILPGNIYLLKDGSIVQLFQPRKTSSRTVRGGVPYEPPPPVFNTVAASKDELAAQVAAFDNPIVKVLAIELGLGGIYAEEICARAGVDKNAIVNEKDIEKVVACIKQLLDEQPNPFVTENEAFPIQLQGKQGTPTESFSAAIESLSPSVSVKKQKTKKKKDVKQHQEAMLEGFEKAIEENKRKGEVIYEKYSEVDALLKKVKKLHSTGGWKLVKEHFPDIKINESKGEITVDI